jgi:hypothetical protein
MHLKLYMLMIIKLDKHNLDIVMQQYHEICNNIPTWVTNCHIYQVDNAIYASVTGPARCSGSNIIGYSCLIYRIDPESKPSLEANIDTLSVKKGSSLSYREAMSIIKKMDNGYSYIDSTIYEHTVCASKYHTTIKYLKVPHKWAPLLDALCASKTYTDNEGVYGYYFPTGV